MTHYRRMSQEQATAALDEFLAERPVALQRLHAELTAHGADPEAMLDGTPESLTALWRWITGHRAALAADPAADSPVEPRETWPSWARHTVTSMRVPSKRMFILLDGLVSYLAQVLLVGAPTSVWALGSPEDEQHHLHHHPVLTGRGHQIFVPTLPMAGMLRLKRGEPSLREGDLAEYAASVVAALYQDPAHPPETSDPPVVVVAEPETLDVGVRADIAAGHPGLVRRMAAELAAQDGVTAVRRSGPDALAVRARDLDADALHLWLAAWLTRHLPFDR